VRCSSSRPDAGAQLQQGAWDRLSGCKVWLVSEQREVAVTDLWSPDTEERIVVAFGRSMG
jgi:hypothetical protein